MHNGCIQTGGGASCPDRSLLDFFQVTDVSGHPDIVYTTGDVHWSARRAGTWDFMIRES